MALGKGNNLKTFVRVETVKRNDASQETYVQVETFFYESVIVSSSVSRGNVQPLRHETVDQVKKISDVAEVIEKHFENTWTN